MRVGRTTLDVLLLKRELIDGTARLHVYLSNLEGYKSIREAYYVSYRLADPSYVFPETINTLYGLDRINFAL
jgi:hypothetical protein